MVFENLHWIERTEGNPFFLEESVRALVEPQVLVGEREAYWLAKPMRSLQVPATVQAVLAARIDRLPPEEKRLLQIATVVGTEVPFPLLQAIVDLPAEAQGRGLAHLQAAEFLYETRLLPELEYTFKHALTHEVAYESLLHEWRKAFHGRIVEAIERLHPDHLTEQVDQLAHHALWGELWDKALGYCRQAGAKAMERSAHREALACFEQAVTALRYLLENPETIQLNIDVRVDLRDALLATGDHERIFSYLREAQTLAEALDDQRQLRRVLGFMASHFNTIGDSDEAIAAGQHALALATTLGDTAIQIGAPQHLGLANEVGMRPLVAHCHLGLGELYLKTGRLEHARAQLSAAIDLYRAMDMTFWLSQTEAALAQVEGR